MGGTLSPEVSNTVASNNAKIVSCGEFSTYLRVYLDMQNEEVVQAASDKLSRKLARSYVKISRDQCIPRVF